MERKIEKAVITCGGYSTRFLPITKAVPKEMLPIIDKPIIHYIVQELATAGITDIQILIGRGRECLMNYFDINYELDDFLQRKGSSIKTNFFPNVNISYRRVPMPRGAADAVMHAKGFVGDDHFLLAYCDNVFFDANPSSELISDFKKYGKSNLLAMTVPQNETHNYGIMKLSPDNYIESIIEKPKSNPPSCLAAMGRYILGSQIFTLIEDEMRKNLPTEVCMVKQFNKMAANGEIRCVSTSATCFDTGSAKGFVEANVYALKLSKNG